MSKSLLITIGLLILLLLAAGLALKKQLEVNGEQRARLEEQAKALNAAEEQRKEAEKATAQRDADITKINQANRRLRDEITKANAGDDCAHRPIPEQLDRLLRQRAPKAGEGLPTGNDPATAPHSSLERDDLGRPGTLGGGPGNDDRRAQRRQARGNVVLPG
jgi:hypothetical protein